MAFTPLRPDDPQQVGAYRLTGQLGAGGMGIVYLARSRAGTPVALKLIRPEFAADPTFRARFSREVETGQRVQGVCIARFLDADPDADRPYLVTEYVDGPGLGEVVAARGPFVGSQLQALAAGLAEGLVSLHRAGVVHRDLKPANVLLARDAPKIIDFGIAHAGDATSMTRTGHVVGSAGWMAPEQAAGERVTSAADVFAWASTMTFAATGRPPFGEGAPAAVIYRVVHTEPDLTGVPEALLPALHAAFAKDPSARPEPARLLAMITGEPGADPSGEITRVLDVDWAPVAPVAVASAAAARAALDQPLSPAPDGATTTSTNSGMRRASVAVAAILAVLLGAGVLWGLTRDDNPSSSAATTLPNTTGAPIPTSTTAVPVTTSAPTTTKAPTTTEAPITTEAPTTTDTPTITTTTAAPSDPAAAWDDVEAGLAEGAASTGVIDGADPPMAVTAVGADVTVWTWNGAAWNETGFLFLDGPVSDSNALSTAKLTGASTDDVLAALDGSRGAVIALPDSGGQIVEFDVPDEDRSVASINDPRIGGKRVTGGLDSVEGDITWRYDADAGRFAVDKGGNGNGGDEG